MVRPLNRVHASSDPPDRPGSVFRDQSIVFDMETCLEFSRSKEMKGLVLPRSSRGRELGQVELNVFKIIPWSGIEIIF
jgi:hypothetical protein